MDHRAHCFHLSFCPRSRHVYLRGSFELRSSRLYLFTAFALCPQLDILAKIFRGEIPANLDLGCRQSMLLTQTGLEMIRDLSVSLLEPAHDCRLVHAARLGFSAALGSSLEPTSNVR